MSSICSGVDMPESTAKTPSSPAANRNAQDTVEYSGRAALISISSRLRDFREHAALYRLHDDDLSAVGANGLIALTGLNVPGVPVEVVQSDLYCLYLRVISKNPVQHIGGIVEGEGDVSDFALFLPLLHVLEQMGVPDNLTVAHPVYIVEQIVVKVAYAAPLQLLGKDFLRLSLISDGENGELGGQHEAIPGVAAYQTLVDRCLTGPVVVGPAGVEVGETRCQEAIHHLADLRIVDVRGFWGVLGQAHHPESKLAAVPRYRGPFSARQSGIFHHQFLLLWFV